MTSQNTSWRTQAFRQSVITKIDEALRQSGTPISQDSIEMENHVFQKANTKEEYLGFIARLILHVREINANKDAAGSRGVGGGQVIPNSVGVSNSSIRPGTGNSLVAGMAGVRPNPQGMGPQQAANTPVRQSLLRQPLPTQNLPSMQIKMQRNGSIPVQVTGPMGSVGPIQRMQGGLLRTPMNQMIQGNLRQRMVRVAMRPMRQQKGQMNQGQIVANQMQQNNPHQMQQNIPHQVQQNNPHHMQQNIPHQVQQNVHHQMQQSIPHQVQQNIHHQMQQSIPDQVQQNIPHQIQQSISHQVQQNIPHQMQTQMGNQIDESMRGNSHATSQTGSGQMRQSLTPGKIIYIQRKPVEMTNAGFSGPRNVTPNQRFQQSPSPLAASPGSFCAPGSNQMVLSPASIPSPSPQHPMMTNQRSIGMAPSPSSPLNTPGGNHITLSPQDDQAYCDKIRQLSKYIEPLRRMVTKMGHEGNLDKYSKMKKLLEILSNPSQRVPLETIIKCEIVLEKLDLKQGESSVGPVTTPMKDQQFFSPLLEAVSANFRSPMANHTLQRTFGPCIEAFFDTEFRNSPPPLKRQRVEEPPSEIPDVLQGEIARLDQRFKVSVDPAQRNGSSCIQLICWLDDRHLPCVPPVSVSVPSDYPLTPPRCVLAPHEYTTAFLCAVQEALNARIMKLPSRFSVSQLLDTWEISVREASAPKQTPVSTGTVLMGL